MRVEIISGGKVLPSTVHDGQCFVQAPTEGDYVIRLINDGLSNKLAVVTVDGMNVVKLDADGKGATYDGPGYVLRPMETLDIEGWRRDDSEVAAFSFQAKSESYAEKMGRGGSNLSMVGVAVFDEKVAVAPMKTHPVPVPVPYPVWPSTFPHHWYGTSDNTGSMGGGHETIGSFSATMSQASLGGSARKGVMRSAVQVNSVSTPTEDVPAVGTSYGSAKTFHTRTVRFQRSSEDPSQLFVLRYASRQQLEAWGVPLPGAAMPAASAFPGETGQAACPAPAGWQRV